ncbi:ABC transporter permease [Romboutsia lituseburensis]|uniref:Putative ABC transport system permease protein n=2 Tax=Romboutsia lituseburensis TaxID=1537 RepID=A0A1G9KA42_9FIRM|nr:ABC transporter permease [Romboutsia lituseburensis]SDL46436.1 putative ABC transport system permease protein [Romboutsia lituseburensis DSM 797]
MKQSLILAIAYLKKQKSRTTALIIGITLAVMLVFGFNVIRESQSKNQLESIYKTHGSYDITFNNVNKDVASKLENDKAFKNSSESADLGEILDENGALIELNASNENYLNQNMYSLKKGRLPQKEGEIALEEKSIERMGLSTDLNQDLKFKIKKEYKDKNNINQVFMKEHKFKLVGIVERPSKVYDEPYNLRAFTYFEEGKSNLIPDNLITYDGVLTLKSDHSGATNKANEFDKMYKSTYTTDESFISENSLLVIALDQYNSSTQSVDHTEILVIITAIFLIYNIFNISLTEMINQIGMLKTIGASKKHIRMIIAFQSFIVLIIGTVLGILLGIVFSYIGIKIYNYLFMDFNKVILYISFNNILLAIKVGVFTVFISSAIQIYSAGKISPINALRKVDKSSGKQKNRFYHKWIRKIFGISGEMAYKNVWRNKVKAIVSILAISMGGILFINDMSKARNNPFKYMDPKIVSIPQDSLNLKYDIYNTDENFVGYTDKDIEQILKIDGVKDINTKVYSNGFINMNPESLQKAYKEKYGFSDKYKVIECSMKIKGYDDKQLNSFKEFIDKGTIPLSSNKVGQYPNAMVFNYYYCPKEYRYKEAIKGLKIGDIIEVKVPVLNEKNIIEYKNSKIRVSAFLNTTWSLKGSDVVEDNLDVIVPQKEVTNYTGKNTYNEIFVKSQTDKSSNINKKLSNMFNEKDSFKTIDSRFAREKKVEDGMKELMQTTLIEVSFLLLIAGLNIFITIKTNFLIRMNEFATLRALGMGIKQIKIMILKESLIYALTSSVIAIVIGGYNNFNFLIIANEMYKHGFGSNNTIPIKLPILEAIEFTIIAIVMCILATYVSKKKIEKLNIVEGLKIKE